MHREPDLTVVDEARRPESDSRLGPAGRELLHEARQVYIGIATPSGPHVTPELHAVISNELWFFTATATLKARRLRKDNRIGFAARLGSRALVGTGDAQIFDVAQLATLARSPSETAGMVRASMLFGLRHAADLGGFVRDFASGRLGRHMPPRRIGVRVRIDDAEVVDVAVAAGDEDGVLGWQNDRGTMVLPVRVGSDGRTAYLPNALAQRAGVHGAGIGCLTVDHYGAPGPAAKQGVLVRGTARATSTNDLVRVEIEPQQLTSWDGIATHTEKLDD